MVNLPIEYSDKQVTPFGGMSLMKRFIDQTGIREYMSDLDLPRWDTSDLEMLEDVITEQELLNALKIMKNGSSPGIDSIPTEF